MLLMNLEFMETLFYKFDNNDTQQFENMVSKWTNKATKIVPFAASANFIIYFEDNNNKYFLRFNEERIKSKVELQSEIEFTQYLISKDIAVNIPIISLDSNYIESFIIEGRLVNAVVYKAIKGTQYELNEFSPTKFKLWGESLANLHNASENYSKKHNRKDWNSLLKEVTNLIPTDDKSFHEESRKVFNELNNIKKSKDCYGLIHFDFEVDNLIWFNESINIIDFDDMIEHWFIADIAYAMRDIFNEGDNINLHDKRFNSFMDGYKKHRIFEPNWLNYLPLMYRLHNLYKYAILKESIKSFIPAKVEWSSKLYTKIQNSIKEAQDTFKK